MTNNYAIQIKEWKCDGVSGATICFYHRQDDCYGGTAMFCYASYEVSRAKAHAFWMRAFKKGIILPF